MRGTWKVRAVLAGFVLAAMLASASMTTWDKPEPERWSDPSPSMIAYARNLYNALGGPYGEAKVYLDRWPEYADEIMGG